MPSLLTSTQKRAPARRPGLHLKLQLLESFDQSHVSHGYFIPMLSYQVLERLPVHAFRLGVMPFTRFGKLPFNALRPSPRSFHLTFTLRPIGGVVASMLEAGDVTEPFTLGDLRRTVETRLIAFVTLCLIQIYISFAILRGITDSPTRS